MKWRNFKIDPPYDVYEDLKNGVVETDPVYAWFTYKYVNKLRDKIFVSYAACEFSQGIFMGYEIQMRDFQFPESQIEVLNWVEDKDVQELLLLSSGVIGKVTKHPS